MSDEITPSEFHQQWSAGQRPYVLDVRRPDEWEENNLASYGAVLIPLQELPARFASVPTDQEIVVHCKAGGRSAQAQDFLRGKGYSRVKNMTGGMDRFLKDVGVPPKA